ncbi:MAG: hypothetical protein ACXW6T_18530, partial [Candidatus Binatia bacterium]
LFAFSGVANKRYDKTHSARWVTLFMFFASIGTRAGYYQGVSERVNRVPREVSPQETKKDADGHLV